MPDSRLRIDVLGTSVTIAASEDPAYLNRLLEKLRKEIEKTQKSTGLDDAVKIAVLAGFSLCDEIEKLKSEKSRDKEKDKESHEAESLTLHLISRLDEVLETKNENDPGGNNKIHKLLNTVKNYPWGSPDWIPALLEQDNPSGTPVAELWMGVHPEGPSRIAEKKEKSENILLSSLIKREPLYYLGEETEKNFGALPFLLKVLAADKPLSIQAHPGIEQAREGFERENSKNIALKAPERNYKDANHKPEIICALTPFTAMCGFREPEEIRTMIAAFSQNAPHSLKIGLECLVSALTGTTENEKPLEAFLKALFDTDDVIRNELSGYATSRAVTEYAQYEKEWKLVSRLAKLYPGDPAVMAPLYLNLIELKTKEALYIPAGVLHAYIYGLGIELMANSDNVLRGGLTPKNIDKEELFRILNFNPYKPPVLKAPLYESIVSASDESDEQSTSDEQGVSEIQGSFETQGVTFTYPVFCKEFSLSFLCGGKIAYTTGGPSIILVTSGELVIESGNQEIRLGKGESAFIPAKEASTGISFSGNYTAYAAGIGEDPWEEALKLP